MNNYRVVKMVPCRGGKTHTNFTFLLNKTKENEVVVEFLGFENFSLSDISWRQDFTNQVATLCEEKCPGINVIFSIN